MGAVGNPLISVDALRALLADPTARASALLIDCRHRLGDPDAGRRAWEAERLPGAQHLHLDRDLSAPLTPGPRGPIGGRHPLPDPAAFGAVMRDLGLRAGSTQQVIAYDDAGGAFAARLWWILRWLGFQRCRVLDGGLGAWRAAEGPLARGAPELIDAAGDWAPAPEPRWILPRRDLEGFGGPLVDCRAPGRYRGEAEPLDPAAGHIPGALNRFWKGALGDDGRIDRAPQIPAGAAVYCGSGVTACVSLLALAALEGREDVPMYVGGWSGWLASGGAIEAGEGEPGDIEEGTG